MQFSPWKNNSSEKKNWHKYIQERLLSRRKVQHAVTTLQSSSVRIRVGMHIIVFPVSGWD
jgi:hypothetical protein